MIYLDNNATTRVAPQVLDAMLPYLSEYYGNASSTHGFGRTINNAVRAARNQVATLIGCDPSELIFTSGASESINLAIKGVAESYHAKGRHTITVETEHPAVLDVCRFLKTRGYDLTYLPVLPDGLIDLRELEVALRPDTILVSVMAVNNETGVQQPIRQIAQLAHGVGALFMSDATQAVGKLPLDVDELDVDLLAFSAHKFYGPKGIGGLFFRQRAPRRVQIEASIHGGGHEYGRRSGTLNVPGIVGMGRACEIALTSMADDALHINALRNQLETELLEIEGTWVNGNRTNRLYNVTNITFPDTDANILIGQMENIAVSNGSACSSAVFEPSHVLKAMHLTDDEALGAIRFSLGRYTTTEDVQDAIKAVKQHLHVVRY